MNERIWELELQSYVTLTKAGLDGRHEKTTTIFDREKFAELIVRECVKLCEHESNDDEYDQYDMGMSVKAENIKTAIKQHFGVEL